MNAKIQSAIDLNFSSEWGFLAPLRIEPMMRIGQNTDGGYVVPSDALRNIDTLISLGIFNDWSFDLHLLKIIPNLEVHAYDHTISKQDFKRGYHRALIKFIKGRLSYSALTEKRELYHSYCSFFSENRKHYQERVHNRLDQHNDVTLDVIFDRTQSKCSFLKIDIEGGEYRIIDDILKYSGRIQVLVMEFHDTDPLMTLFISAVKKLQEKFDLVHLHVNNYGKLASNRFPEVLEITFVKKGMFFGDHKRATLPLDDLDFACNTEAPDYKINFAS